MRARPPEADAAYMTPPRTEIDDRFVGDWFAFGLAQLEAYLANHARFEAYCARRDGRALATR
jgi:hypothetical protein